MLAGLQIPEVKPALLGRVHAGEQRAGARERERAVEEEPDRAPAVLRRVFGERQSAERRARRELEDLDALLVEVIVLDDDPPPVGVEEVAEVLARGRRRPARLAGARVPGDERDVRVTEADAGARRETLARRALAQHERAVGRELRVRAPGQLEHVGAGARVPEVT